MIADQMPPTAATFPRGFSTNTRFAWPLLRADQVLRLNYGKSLPEKLRRPGSVPVYGTNGQCGTHDTALTHGPGIIVGRKGMGHLGVEWCECDFWVIDTAYHLQTLTKAVHQKFMYYLIRYIGVNHLKDGTSNPSLTRDAFGRQLLPIPPIIDQQAISYILSSFDEKLVANDRITTSLRALGIAIFNEFFTGPEVNSPKRHLSFEDTDWGWRYARLGDLLLLDRGLSYKGEGLSEQGMPMINLGCFGDNGTFQYAKMKHYEGEHRSRHVVSVGDIVIANTDITQKRLIIGSPELVRSWRGHRQYIFTHHVYAARFNGDHSIYNRLIYYWLLRPEFRSRAMGYAAGTTVLSLPADAILDLTVSIPSHQIAQKFNEFIEPIWIRIAAADSESDTLTSLRDTLLPKLLSGEIRIKDAEKLVSDAV